MARPASSTWVRASLTRVKIGVMSSVVALHIRQNGLGLAQQVGAGVDSGIVFIENLVSLVAVLLQFNAMV
jgi:hypothetical protein